MCLYKQSPMRRRISDKGKDSGGNRQVYFLCSHCCHKNQRQKNYKRFRCQKIKETNRNAPKNTESYKPRVILFLRCKEQKTQSKCQQEAGLIFQTQSHVPELNRHKREHQKHRQIHVPMKNEPTDRSHDQLNSREYEVALLASDRLTNSEIAQKLFITESTVKFHLSNILENLGIKKRKDLGHALESIYLSPTPPPWKNSSFL